MPASHHACALLILSLGLGAAEAAAPRIAFDDQVQPGNIFTVGERVEILAGVPAGDQVAWRVTDWTGREVAKGTAPVAEQRARIVPGVGAKGYFSLFLDAINAAGTGRTAFAIIPPADVAQLADSRFGVMTHFAQNMPTDFLPLLAKAGIAHVRDEQYWAAIEKTRGAFTFPAGFEGYMRELAGAGPITPLICMSFGNPLYDAQKGIPAYKLAPDTPEARAAYADYCVEVLNHYGKQIPVAEIWNEYNGTFCAGSAATDRPRSYNDLLAIAYARIKAARPDVRVLGGATVKIPLPYLEKLFQGGALQHMDGIAVHPYMSPDEAEESLAKLVELVKRHNAGQGKPIWCTEFGTWQDHSPERSAAAVHLVRMCVAMLTQPDVERMYWYLARDYAPDFANMGLVHDQHDPMGRLTPVMAYPAYANLIGLLHRATCAGRAAADPRSRLYRFSSPARDIWVGWSMAGTATLAVTASAPVTVVDLMGGERSLVPKDGLATVVLDDMPVYLVADRGVIAGVAEIPRSDAVIADSERDYAGPGSSSAWSYLYCASNRDGTAAYDPARAKAMAWTPSPGDWADTWNGPGRWFCIGRDVQQPGVVDGGQGWAIRRWTSPIAAAIHVRCSISTSAKGDGCGFKVFRDGAELASKRLSAAAKDAIDLAMAVEPGTRLDFVATPGPATDVDFDLAGFRIQVLTPAK